MAVVRGLASVRPHYRAEKRELLRILLNAASPAEADFALHILKDSMPERDLVSAVNMREGLAELPSCPFPMAIDCETLSRIARLERDRNAWRRTFSDPDGEYSLVLLGDGNLCYDLIISAEAGNVFWTPHPRNGAIIHPDALDLVLERETLLREVIGIVMAMGMSFSPTFYLSLDDWMLEYAEQAMSDLGQLF